jgi:hypothetical protein
MKLKKILIGLIAVLMILTVVSCGQNNKTTAKPTKTEHKVKKQ